MEASPLLQWLGGQYQVVLREPAGERVIGLLSNLVPEQHLTLQNVTIPRTGQRFEQIDIGASNVADIIRLDLSVPPAPPSTTSAAAAVAVATNPPSDPIRGSFHDPAIVSMTRKPVAAPPMPSPRADSGDRQQIALVTNSADNLTYSSLDETDTTTATTLDVGPISQLSLETPSKSAVIDTTEDETQNLTPTATTAAGSSLASRERRRKRGKKQQGARPSEEVAQTSNARPTNQSTGWRQTPILQSTKSFQPYASLRKGRKGRADPNAENGWASEDVTDVQEAGDFDFEGSLAKFDKRTIFNEMQAQDRIDEAERLVSHNRLPRPKPGTAGGKNLHYSEYVLDMATPASRAAKETPGDFWRSEADDDVARHGGRETPSGREGSGRNSRLRNESRLSTGRRSQSRKASASGTAAAPNRVNSGVNSALPPSVGGLASHGPKPPAVSPTLAGLYTVTSNRRIDMVTHLQMLVVENVASNELGMTEELIAENAGRGISEVAMRALEDPAIKLRTAATTPPVTRTMVVLAGNNRSGARAIAAARHLRNRNINILVCVVGIERERELLEEMRRQIRLLRNFGGSIYTKSELFEHLAQPATTSLHSSPQAPVSLIIDALLGLTISFEELRKSDQATTYELMEWANRNEAFVMAIDIPSGIEPSSGRVNVIDGAKLYVQPRYVVALGAPKSGLVKALGSMYEQGDVTMADEWKVYLADIGLGALVWRKAAKLRRGPEFDDNWVLELQYQPRMRDD
ncbi:YjeF N-terminal domain-like protein [Xylariaceae sp. FL0594]|nr:YjeF N-terminal domain-like protein [Xylariaceae sp. FL0594]